MPSVRWGLGTGADVCVPFSGNATLSGCRIIGAGLEDDDVVLAWDEHAVDVNTVGCWRMNGDWTDASGNGHDATPVYGPTFTAGWYDRAGSFVRTSYQGLEIASDDALNIIGDMTFECWWYRTTAYSSNWESLLAKRAFGAVACPYGVNMRNGVLQWYFADTAFRVCSHNSAPPLNAWTHLAFTRESGILRIWVNGTSVKQSNFSAYSPTATADNLKFCQIDPSHETLSATLDDMRLSNVSRYVANFTPVRYKSASQNAGIQPFVQCSHSSLTGMVPAAVSWSATTGAGYGQVKRVLVNDVSAGWTAVGGDYPTSPVAISGLVLASEDAVRVELEPKADTLQSETPVLDWLHLEYLLPSGGRVYRPTPMRLGPKLIPIGVF